MQRFYVHRAGNSKQQMWDWPVLKHVGHRSELILQGQLGYQVATML